VLLGLLCLAGGLVAGLHRTHRGALRLAPVCPVGAVLAAVRAVLAAARWAAGRGAAALVGFVLLVPPSLAIAHLRLLSPWLLLGVMAAVWVADIAAYFTGRAFGRRKLAPSISPGKSWEGAYGAVVGVVSGLACLIHRLPHVAGQAGAGAGRAGGLHGVSIIGDLFESLVKRQAGVKDSGTLLPGHGGILDRIDSLTSTLPLAALRPLDREVN
jgi:phosphatidate cytidylyltransferase